MATSASSEATEIRRRGRRRLIGVIAIVALLVVFVPMLFDSEQRPARNDPALVIPSKDNAPALPPPSPAKAAPAAPKSEPPAPAPAVAAPKAAAPAEAAKAPPAKEPPAVARVTPDAGSRSVPKLEGFAVQVGAFRDDAKLKQAREKLAAAGVPHYTERLDTASGELTRLRAGPFPTRAAAEAALGKVRGEKLEGQVVTLP